MTLLIIVSVVSASIVGLAWPLIRPELAAMESDAGPASHMAVLEERKLSIYGAIRDVGFDFRTDKITDSDYQREVATLKSEAVAVLREMETLRSSPPRGDDELEQAIDRERARLRGGESGAPAGEQAGKFCTQCGAGAGSGDQFCAGCGAALRKGA